MKLSEPDFRVPIDVCNIMLKYYQSGFSWSRFPLIMYRFNKNDTSFLYSVEFPAP